MIASMAATLCMWLLLSASFVGVGSGIVRLGIGCAPTSIARSFWIGFATWIAVLQGLHALCGLASPWVTGLLCILGATGFFVERAAISRSLGSLRGADGRTRLGIAGAVLLALWLANRAQGPLLTVDSGLYHLSAIKWAAELPLSVGLGNLHPRLAYNNATFLWLASLDAWPDWFRGFNVGQSLLVLAAIVQLVALLLHRGHRTAGTKAVSIFHALLILPLFYAATVMHVSSTGTDWGVLVVGVVLASELWSLFADEADGELLLGIAALCAVGITIKLSFAVFAATAMTLAAVEIGRLRRSQLSHSIRPLIAGLCLAAMLLIPWSLRGVALSGYPAFPSAAFAQDVSWRISDERVEEEVRWIRSWARAPGKTPDEVLGKTDWIRPWIASRLRNADSVALLVIPGIILVIALSAGAVSRRTKEPRRLLVALPSALSIVSWIATAPDPRFLGAAVWICAAVALSSGALRSSVGAAGIRFELSAWIGAASMLAFTAIMASWVGGAVIQPGPREGRYPLREVETKIFRTDSGLVLYVPRFGNQCWSAPLPCTPYPSPRLGLRFEADPTRGFEMK